MRTLLKPTQTPLFAVLILALLLSSCQPQSSGASVPSSGALIGLNEPAVALAGSPAENAQSDEPTPIPARPQYGPGELVDYIVQTGDSLPALAARFNTTVAEIRQANPFIPNEVTTLPPSMPMRIPIYYLPLWGTPFQIIPDSLFILGPAQVGFDTAAFIAQHPGWLNGYVGMISGYPTSGAQIIDRVALDFSISPRLLLALLEYQTGALTNPEMPSEIDGQLLGIQERGRVGLFRQLNGAANQLNNGYYRWRSGTLLEWELLNGRLERPDPWQNAATVTIQYYFARLLPQEDYNRAISAEGIAATYSVLFGNPWDPANPIPPHIPGSLLQPDFRLPFEIGKTWAYTGGPHTGWGSGEPLAAIDFAPPSVVGGCNDTEEWSTAVASGVIVRSEEATVVLDLDGDGDERTGWTVFYLHLATKDRAPLGKVVEAGEPVGHPSCEGGRATGTHTHIARKYNGEWILADGPLSFNMEGWVAKNGPQPYLGSLTRFSDTVTACECSDYRSHIRSERQP